ncbi:MAG TPA: LemA family protein, partial [Candidatus Thermoplasmatota archaeon]|nr:LemA family protein [Candidatus Thermoplasmatota archaeon]
TQDEAINGQSKQIDVQYQQAFNVVPQLERLTREYMSNERQVMENVTALRSGYGRAINGSLTEKDAYLGEMGQFINLLGRQENYPQLRADRLFQDTMDHIVNYNNKIAVEKTRYNDRVQEYNTYRRLCCLPAFMANTFGFEEREYIGYSNRPNQTSFPAGQPLVADLGGKAWTLQ